tara:strand:- start:461 stop:748 length:288 start_codon:yes stop_codon:yes gene_type:complete
MTEQESKELQELKDAVNFLKKGFNDLASENKQLKIDLLEALDYIKGKNPFKEFLDHDAVIKQQTAQILTEISKTSLFNANFISRLHKRIKRLEKK